MKNNGQAILIVILILGVIMAAVVIFGAKRQADTAVLIERLDISQTAQEVLSGAAKKVQYIYANESGCDPDVLDSRLSNLNNLPTDASADFTAAFGVGMSYAVAQPSIATLPGKANRCTNATGCRQFGVPLENRVYIVTAGAVVTGAGRGGGLDCPRDATIRLSMAAGGNVYYQRFSLINICTFDSCNSGDDFSSVAAVAVSGENSTYSDACGTLDARWHGSMISANNWEISVNDLRWARRYIETGAGSIGETSFLYHNATPSGNGTCVSGAASAFQCVNRNCVPAFDLNRDRTNNEVDLAILEAYLRGFIPVLSPNRIDSRN